MIHLTTIGLTSASNAASPDTAMEVAMPDDSNNPNTRVGAMAPDASTSPVEWGPEIRVDGKRPEWLDDAEYVRGRYKEGKHTWYKGYADRVSAFDWSNLGAIRLPADHPHYLQPTTPELDPALWDRMVAFVRRVAGGFHLPHVNDKGIPHWEAVEQARAIVADLPKPVDPDLIEARKIAACDGFYEGTRETVERGEHDEAWPVRIALAAIKRGRQLATPEVSHVG